MLLATDLSTWAEIAEKLGIPFAILAFLLIGLVAVVRWLGKHVVQPLMESHLRHMDQVHENLKKLSANEAEQTSTLKAVVQRQDETREALAKKQEQTHELVMETRDLAVDLTGHVRQVKGIVSKLATSSDVRQKAAPPPGTAPAA